MMKRLALLTLLAALPAHSQTNPASGAKPVPAPIVFFDIAGPDLASQRAFYATVFGWEIGPAGNTSAPVTPGASLNGFLRTDPTEKVIYLGVEDIKATEARIVAAGGRIDAPRYVVPGVVIMALFVDPAGNRMGLVEMKDGKAIIP